MDQLVATRGPHRLLKPRTEVEAEAFAEALHEILGSWVCASPSAGWLLLRVVDDVARRHDDLDLLAADLDAHAVALGQRGEGEACELLLEASDSVRAAADHIATNTNDREG